ncbi:hypothetical protein C5Y93_14790 [Blastopirellula marina]|uniref:Uncharacterized protein n=2 Tax=Blastopirellula marina TaxID=124 RepID=A0A2S8GLB4_9BACT|nr:hypothetical protein C5Y93_14790 [Blastopirellula marina]
MVAAVVSMVSALALAGAFLPGLIYLDACTTIGSLIMMPPLIGFAIQQYRGTFRANETALLTAAAGALLPVGLAGLMLVTLSFQGAPLDLLSMVGGVLLIFGGAAAANFHWYRTLRLAPAECRFVPSRRGISLREMFFAVAAIGLIFAVGLPLAKPHYAHKVAASETPFSLPKGAKDVTYMDRNPQTFYMYTVDEQTFLDFYQDSYELEPIEGSASILALTNCTETAYNITRKQVFQGWVYEWHHEDQGTYLIYDRDQQRVYYHSHTR